MSVLEDRIDRYSGQVNAESVALASTLAERLASGAGDEQSEAGSELLPIADHEEALQQEVQEEVDNNRD